MRTYFYLQLKRVAKIVPFVMAVTVALFVSVAVILYGLLGTFFADEANTRFTVAIVGDTDNVYMRWGLSAMQTFDETRFSIAFSSMSEADAREALEKGGVAAYVVIPEAFVEKALSGDIEPITYVTSVGMEGLNGLFKKEITALVTDMVIYSQKGTYGVAEALRTHGWGQLAGQHMEKISLEFVELIFKRNELYTVEEAGVSDGLSTPQYYVCAVAVMLCALCGLPFATVYIKRDYAFERLLLARGYSVKRQLACEYGVQLLAMLLQAAVMLALAALALTMMPTSADGASFVPNVWAFAGRFLPILVMMASFNTVMFELSDNLVSGLLLHVFVVIGMCYVSGCLYPVYAFPRGIQAVAAVLPTGLARRVLATAFTSASSAAEWWGPIVYTAVFLTVAGILRYRKTAKIRG